VQVPAGSQSVHRPSSTTSANGTTEAAARGAAAVTTR
jgi:hypothetical protein